MNTVTNDLIVWNPEEQEIVGGYRFIDGAEITANGDWQHDLSMSHYFQFSEKFISEYLPFSIELGRRCNPSAPTSQ